MNRSCVLLAATLLFVIPESWASSGAFDTVVDHTGIECGFYLHYNPTVQWNGEGDPPLAVSRVREIVDRWATDRYGDKSRSAILSYKLWSVVPKGSRGSTWLYKIEFLILERGVTSPLFSKFVVVTMDEGVIESTCDAQ